MRLSLRSLCLIKFVGFFALFSILMRFLFLGIFWGESGNFKLSEMFYAFYLGAKFDVRVALVLALPLALFFWLPFLDPFKKQAARKFWTIFYTAICFVALGFFVVDIAYYKYLHGRLNATIMDFFKNPLISLQMVWETYPVITLFMMGFVFAAVVYWLLKTYIFIDKTSERIPFKKKWIAGLLIFIGYVGGLHGKFSQYPLRWSEAYFSTQSFVAATAMNPIHYFFDTIKNAAPNFDEELTKKYYDQVAAYLNVENPNKETLNFKRPIKLGGPANIDPENPPNIVVIVLESLAGYKTGALGHPLKPTPYFDEASSTGMLFREFYVPSEATARSIYCLITGIPDVNPQNGSSSRNPLIIDQNTVANAFKGYEKFYFIGGSANWGNIRGVITNNIEEIQMVEEGDFESPRTDVWGISDLHLFREAHKTLSKREAKKPFLAFIQSAGFHRPYTIPEDKGEFKLQTLDSKELKRFGFISNEEYNSLRFQDYAFGEFYHLSKKDPAFKNTIFLVIGDHGLPDYRAEHVSKGSKHFYMERWHVPMAIYGPGLIEPRIIDDLVTEPDVLPTLAGLTGHPHINTTLGENYFMRNPEKTKYVFNFVYYETPPQIGVFDQEFYVMGRPGKPQGLFQYRSETPDIDVKDKFPQKWQEMKDLAEGLYQTSRYMLYHNSKKSIEERE